MTTTIVATGLGLLLLIVAGVVVLWTVDARRAERVAADPERVEGQPGQPRKRRRWGPNSGHR